MRRKGKYIYIYIYIMPEPVSIHQNDKVLFLREEEDHHAQNQLEADYEKCLNELAKTISGKNRNVSGDVSWEDQFKTLHEYVDELNLRHFLETRSNAIHVAGTKGKGSTCAFCESVLLENKVKNVGLFTSPHLVDVRERFRINGEPVGKREFIEAFWWTKTTIEKELKMELPAYFRFLFLLGLKIFKDAGTECLILEVGLGGRLDATNCVREPKVVAVTSLGLDHVEVLGDTIEKIAWEKAGIFKNKTRAFTSPQVPEAMKSLERKKEEVGCELVVARQIDLDGNDEDGNNTGGEEKVELGLSGPHQRINASLAVELVKEWARKTKHRGILAELEKEREKKPEAKLVLPDTFRRGLEKTRWPGREQIVRDEHSKNLTFYLDGAHTEESMRTCAEWFSAHVNAKRKKDGQHDNCYNDGKQLSSGMCHNVFLFNCMEERSPKVLLSASVDVLKSKNVRIDTAMFCPPDSSALGLVKVEDDKKNLEWQEACATTWREIEKVKGLNTSNFSNSNSSSSSSGQTDVRASVAGAISALRRKADLVAPKRVDVLVAGSLYLVGDILRQLKKLGVK